MDEFYEYWELIPEFDKYENVGKVRNRLCGQRHSLLL
jgi:hypothetical protein